MANIPDIYSLHASQELLSSPASRLKNAFKPVFQQALKHGAVSITRNRKREAVLLSSELYDRIIEELASRDPLNTLRQAYDNQFAAMQTPRARQGYEDAFQASPDDLGKAAVDQAGA
jgi:PHD/YefM family antitoxin component YafN of YafNO toxin-antitoxin module